MEDDVQASIREAVATVSKEQGYSPDNEAGGFATQSLAPDTPAAAEPEKIPEKTETKTGEEDSIIIDPNAAEEEEETETPVVKEPTKTTEEEGEDAFAVSPEELDRIQKDPGLNKLYKGMVRGFSTKTSALSTIKKTYEADHAAIEALKKDPHGVLKQMVEAAGLKLAEEPTPAVPAATEAEIDAEIVALLKANIGEEAANVLGPALVKVVKTVTGKAIAPIQKDNEERVKSEGALRLKSQIADFGTRVVADGGDWDETVEQEMAALVGKVMPGKDVTLPDFLTILHNTVQTNRRAKEGNKREVVRLTKAKAKDEPVRPTKPNPAPTEPVITAGMNEKEATKLALAAARLQVAGR